MDSPNASRIAPTAAADDLNLLGEFNSRVLSTRGTPGREDCTLRVFVDRLEIPELALSLGYEETRDVSGGPAGDFQEVLLNPPPDIGRVIVVKFIDEDGHTRDLALSWGEVEGPGSVEYCEIMLYRAFAAHKVRSKNNGAPCYGIVGY